MSQVTLIPPFERQEAHDEYSLLMSLALDNLLDAQEAHQLQTHLSTCEPCNQQWQTWQAIDRQFQVAPMLSPPVDFVQRVGTRLERAEKRRETRVGLLLAGLTLLIWTIGFAGIGVLLGLMIYNQVGWFGQTLHGLAYAWTMLAVVGESVWRVMVGLSENPSAIGAALCYVALVVLILVGWTRFLRRTIRPLDVQSI